MSNATPVQDQVKNFPEFHCSWLQGNSWQKDSGRRRKLCNYSDGVAGVLYYSHNPGGSVHRAEFRNSSSSARFLSLCKQNQRKWDNQ